MCSSYMLSGHLSERAGVCHIHSQAFLISPCYDLPPRIVLLDLEIETPDLKGGPPSSQILIGCLFFVSTCFSPLG